MSPLVSHALAALGGAGYVLIGMLTLYSLDNYCQRKRNEELNGWATFCALVLWPVVWVLFGLDVLFAAFRAGFRSRRK